MHLNFANADLDLLLALNTTLGGDSFRDALISGIGNNPMLRGFPVFFFLVVLWFSTDSVQRRARMLVGLVAACIATVTSVWLQYHILVHVRPFLDPTLNLHIIAPTALTVKWERLDSFPSDTATLYLSLSMVIFLENRLAGGIAAFWSLFTIGILRVAMGYHYPSDILGGLVLGPGTVYLLTRLRFLTLLVERALARFAARTYVVHALLFIFLADAYNVFEGLQGISHGAKLISAHMGGWWPT